MGVVAPNNTQCILQASLVARPDSAKSEPTLKHLLLLLLLLLGVLLLPLLSLLGTLLLLPSPLLPSLSLQEVLLLLRQMVAFVRCVCSLSPAVALPIGNVWAFGFVLFSP